MKTRLSKFLDVPLHPKCSQGTHRSVAVSSQATMWRQWHLTGKCYNCW